MQNNFGLRIVLDILIFSAVIHGWWFIAVPLALSGAWKYAYFCEFIIAGIIYDSLFGLVPGNGVAGYAGIILSIVLLLLVAILKRVLRR
ncbi:MAG: hypothetical protein AAB365_01225 [Patescibacteria group bacterium]